MKLHKKLAIAGESYDIVGDDARLNLLSPGRASFVVKHDKPLSGIVTYSCGYDAKNIKPWFVGFIQSSTKVDAKQKRIFCRELSAMLEPRLPLSLRDVTLADVLRQIASDTKLSFVTPEEPRGYTHRRAARFYNISGGYFALDSLAKVFGIENHIWQQQADGRIFVGDWNDSHWASKPVTLPNSFESEVRVLNGATLPAFPSLRPGALYNGNVITSVEFSGLRMKLTWSDNPWTDL